MTVRAGRGWSCPRRSALESPRCFPAVSLPFPCRFTARLSVHSTVEVLLDCSVPRIQAATQPAGGALNAHETAARRILFDRDSRGDVARQRLLSVSCSRAYLARDNRLPPRGVSSMIAGSSSGRGISSFGRSVVRARKRSRLPYRSAGLAAFGEADAVSRHPGTQPVPPGEGTQQFLPQQTHRACGRRLGSGQLSSGARVAWRARHPLPYRSPRLAPRPQPPVRFPGEYPPPDT